MAAILVLESIGLGILAMGNKAQKEKSKGNEDMNYVRDVVFVQ